MALGAGILRDLFLFGVMSGKILTFLKGQNVEEQSWNETAETDVKYMVAPAQSQ